MRAMRMARPGAALALTGLPDPDPGPREVRVQVSACGQTDSHAVDGHLRARRAPLTPGHEILGTIANLTRKDPEDFLALAPKVGVKMGTTPYPLERANKALADLRAGRLQGATVLTP